MFHKGDNICDFLFAFLHTIPFWKWIYSNRKAFAPMGSKCFPFRVDPFQKGDKQFWQFPTIKVHFK